MRENLGKELRLTSRDVESSHIVLDKAAVTVVLSSVAREETR
jgi:hypothetical protein